MGRELRGPDRMLTGWASQKPTTVRWRAVHLGIRHGLLQVGTHRLISIVHFDRQLPEGGPVSLGHSPLHLLAQLREVTCPYVPTARLEGVRHRLGRGAIPTPNRVGDRGHLLRRRFEKEIQYPSEKTSLRRSVESYHLGPDRLIHDHRNIRGCPSGLRRTGGRSTGPPTFDHRSQLFGSERFAEKVVHPRIEAPFPVA